MKDVYAIFGFRFELALSKRHLDNPAKQVGTKEVRPPSASASPPPSLPPHSASSSLFKSVYDKALEAVDLAFEFFGYKFDVSEPESEPEPTLAKADQGKADVSSPASAAAGVEANETATNQVSSKEVGTKEVRRSLSSLLARFTSLFLN